MMRSGPSVLAGWIDADPTLVGIVVLAVALTAIAFVILRIRGRRRIGQGDG